MNSALFLIFGLILCHLVLFCGGVTKIFKHDVNIHNPENWIISEDEEDCEGLIFPDTLNGISVLDNVDVKEIVLPKEGNIFFTEDANIELNVLSTDKLNCVFLNQSKFVYTTWADKNNWIIKGTEFNPAMPHKEIAPCEHDDIIIPLETPTLNIYYSTTKLKCKSLKIGTDLWTNDDFIIYKDSDVLSQIFSGYSTPNDVFDVTKIGCEDPSGCICGNTEINDAVCWSLYNYEEQPCLDPITPIGFCTEICGAYILFKPKKIFKIDTLKEILKGYGSYSYASKVAKDMIEQIQVVFTETDFQGTSLYDANDLHQKLLNDPNLGARNVKLISSQVKPSESSTVGIVFGTLLGVFAVFGLIFLIYSPKYRQLIRSTLEDRLNIPIRSSRQTFTTQFMAKYRKDEDSGPFVDSQSTRGSVVSLEKSFENPLFGKSTPSTSNYDAHITSGVTKAIVEVENPVLETTRLEELRDIAENGDLVDLSDTNTNIS